MHIASENSILIGNFLFVSVLGTLRVCSRRNVMLLTKYVE